MNRFEQVRAGIPGQSPQVLSVSSGKGGVGKTNIVINLAIQMQRKGLKVLVFDADLGLSNVPILLGMAPEYDLSHVLQGSRTMGEVLLQGPEGIMVLPAGRGIQGLGALTEEQQLKLLCETEQLKERFDVVLLDTGSGISPNVIYFNIASSENVIVLFPEPAAMANAYTLMKILAVDYDRKAFRIILNGVKKEEEAQGIIERFGTICQRFLNVSVSCVGTIPYDMQIRKAVGIQKAVVELYPKAAVSQCFDALASKLLAFPSRDLHAGDLRFFWKRVFSPQASGEPVPSDLLPLSSTGGA